MSVDRSLSEQFAKFRRDFVGVRSAFNGSVNGSVKRNSNRWNTIGRTRRRLAEILTAQLREMKMGGDVPRFPDAVVLPENIRAMRLVGKARIWEDAHSWEAFATWADGGVCWTFYSFDTMTACVRAGRVHPIGKDGEVSV